MQHCIQVKECVDVYRCKCGDGAQVCMCMYFGVYE